MKWVGRRLTLKSTKTLIVILSFLFSLRVINWFQYPYTMASGDFRPPFNSEAFTKRVLYTWDEIDFGMPSIYAPRILDPFYFLVTAFRTFGLDLYFSELMAVFLMYFFSTILVYMFVKQLTDDATISVVAALFFTSNVYLINDREITAVGFIGFGLAILPSLILFARGIRTYSYKLMVISGILGVIAFGTFPNYRATIIWLLMQGLTLLYFFLKNQVGVDHDRQGSRVSLKFSLNTHLLSVYARLLAVFGLAFLLASMWVLVLISSNLDVLTATYQETSANTFLGALKIYDVTRLIAKWNFYNAGLDMPYVPYRNTYLNIPWFVFLCFLPATLAFASLLVSKEHKTSVFFGVVALISLFLASGFSFSDYGNQLYLALVDFFMLRAFREASNWIFFVIISFGILIGCTVSALNRGLKRNVFKALSLGLITSLFLSTAYPLATGDVARNFLDPSIKGSHVPSSYAELNTMLSSQYWAILAGGRGTYLVYNFSDGPYGCGNPYPLMFSKPVISGIGTEYIQSGNAELVDEINRVMLTDHNIAPEGSASASSIQDDRYLPANAIDDNWRTRWSSQRSVPQWLEIDWKGVRWLSRIEIVFESAYAKDYAVETWNGTTWATHLIVQNNTSTEISHSFAQPIDTTKLRLYFTKVTERFPSVSLWEVKVYARTMGVPKFLGVLGIKQVIVEKNIIMGAKSSPEDLALSENQDFTLVKDWDEISLYNTTYALERLYLGDNTIGFSTLDEMCKLAENLPWDILQHSLFVDTTSAPQTTDKTLVLPTNLAWIQRSPTNYEAHVQSRGTFILVFLESYDQRWKLYVNGSAVSEANHMKVNAFANGWLIDTTGNLAISIEYETQNLLNIAIVASIALPALFLALLGREELNKIARLVHRILGGVLGRKSINPRDQSLKNLPWNDDQSYKDA